MTNEILFSLMKNKKDTKAFELITNNRNALKIMNSQI